ncbi:Uncharacterised protein [Bordetella pertussis]|nr:Uncharacterised protein [Bordetella pertussis]CFO75421.1 Uncharacterised protein [Bordetella pertussis]CFU86410.1 Uncharacterised protein [Bordetella pertussis]CPI39478.1 Uncharacterised protein [Bordetella pertussis]CPL53288.1 Uncharacterised protein [Bordetella pertussis]
MYSRIRSNTLQVAKHLSASRTFAPDRSRMRRMTSRFWSRARLSIR